MQWSSTKTIMFSVCLSVSISIPIALSPSPSLIGQSFQWIQFLSPGKFLYWLITIPHLLSPPSLHWSLEVQPFLPNGLTFSTWNKTLGSNSTIVAAVLQAMLYAGKSSNAFMKTAIVQTLYQLFKWQHLLFYSLDAGANRDLIEKDAQGTTVSEVSGWRLKSSGIIFSLRNSVCHMHGSCFNSYLHVMRNHSSQP